MLLHRSVQLTCIYTSAGNRGLCVDSAYVRVENTAVRDRSTGWLCVSVPPSGRYCCPSLFNLAAKNENNRTCVCCRYPEVCADCVLHSSPNAVNSSLLS